MNSNITLTPEDAALIIVASDSGLITNPRWEHGEQWHKLKLRLEACAALVPAPLNGDKVWYGLTGSTPQIPTIVRAKSKAEAVRLLSASRERMSASHFSAYWCETGNRAELCAAKERGVYVNLAEGWVKK